MIAPWQENTTATPHACVLSVTHHLTCLPSRSRLASCLPAAGACRSRSCPHRHWRHRRHKPCHCHLQQLLRRRHHHRRCPPPHRCPSLPGSASHRGGQLAGGSPPATAAAAANKVGDQPTGVKLLCAILISNSNEHHLRTSNCSPSSSPAPSAPSSAAISSRPPTPAPASPSPPFSSAPSPPTWRTTCRDRGEVAR